MIHIIGFNKYFPVILGCVCDFNNLAFIFLAFSRLLYPKWFSAMENHFWAIEIHVSCSGAQPVTFCFSVQYLNHQTITSPMKPSWRSAHFECYSFSSDLGQSSGSQPGGHMEATFQFVKFFEWYLIWLKTQ